MKQSINIKRETHIIAQHNLACREVGELDKVLRSFPQGHLEKRGSACVGLREPKRETKERPSAQTVSPLHLKAKPSPLIRPAADISSGVSS